ncbi:hypothetical protein HDU84_004116 [Entophlyctis sp. JEL0112]|nr:hypothetical protein HDU84_004116 [Entophlyctis sp. JEL0112]
MSTTKTHRRRGGEALALNLPQLQNLVRRDPASYTDEFRQQTRHWSAQMQLLTAGGSVGAAAAAAVQKEDSLTELINFLAHTVSCYPKEKAAKDFPEQLIDLLQSNALALKPDIRRSMVQALILLRNRDVIPIARTIPLFFSLFRVQDKDLRKLLQAHIVSDIKNANAKAKNNKLNKTMQNFMYTMLKDEYEVAARKSLDCMIELYRKNVWNDAKTVNVVAEAVFSTHPKIAATAVHFFLGTNDDKKDEDEDESNGGVDINQLKHRMQINKKKGSRSNAVEKAMASIKKKARAKERAESFNFSALHLLHSAQDFADKLFARLKQITANSGTFKYDLRLAFINLLSRLIGIHKLLILPFYTYITPYLAPHQRQVPRLLAYTAQASHDLVPPDILSPVVQAIADKFVWSNSAAEVVVAGLNAIREVCTRCPLAMGEELLGSLVDDYRNHRDKASMMAVRALLAVYRDVDPLMLKKKHRGKSASMGIADAIGTKGAAERPVYGGVNILDVIEGADLLLEEEEATKNEEANGGASLSDPGEGWDEWEVDSEAEIELAAKAKTTAKAIVEVLDGESVGDDEDWSDEDEGTNEVSEIGDGEELEGDKDSDDDESDNEDENPKTQVMGPKARRLAKQEARKNLESRLAMNAEKKQKVIQSLAERIYTDEDFEKMRELAANRKAEVMAGLKPSRAKQLMEEDDDENGESMDRDVVDPRRIVAGVKRKATYQERMQSIQEGREGREKYGSKMGKKKLENGGSTTNREKQKKTKNFQMIAHKRSVVGKKSRSLREKQRVLREHIAKQKKKGF